MHSSGEHSLERDLDAAVIHAASDASTVQCLIDGLRHQDKNLRVDAVDAWSDLDTGLCRCRNRCIVFLSVQRLGWNCTSKLVSFAAERGRDSVVVVMDDDGGRTSPGAGEWGEYLCLLYTSHCLNELCRTLALVISTPLLPRRPHDVTGYSGAFRSLIGRYRFILPGFRRRLQELYDHRSCVKRLLIICAESCSCPRSLEIEGSINVLEGVYVLRNVVRSGHRHRDFNLPVYCIRDGDRNCDYYFVAHFPSFAASLSDIWQSGLAGIDETGVRVERNNHILHVLQLLERDYRAKNYRLLYWRDKAGIPLDKFLLPIVREELENEPSEVGPAPETPIDFKYTDGPGVNPGSLFVDPEKCYKLDSRPKGLCLIINVSEFESSATMVSDADRGGPMSRRTGSDADVAKLEGVFRWLKFEPQVHTNLEKAEFLRLLDSTRELDHSAYDAFVCCIMSHGTLGRIYTADNQPVQILEEIAQRFYPESCPTLAGKPKIFFFQCCLTTGYQADPGDLEVSPYGSTSDAEVDEESYCPNKVQSLLIPDAPDIFMSYSTLPDCPSFRLDTGTLYVDALTEVLKKGLELQDSLNEVAQRVEQKAADCNFKHQRPFYYVSNEHKSVYLCGKLFFCCVQDFYFSLYFLLFAFD